MKRKLYFFLERLEISKNERISITILMGLFAILSTATLLYEPPLNYSEEEYERLEMLFREKSRASEVQRREILARYDPAVPGNAPAIAEVSESGIVSSMPGQGQQPASGGRNREGSPDWGNSDARTSGARLAGAFAETTSAEEDGQDGKREAKAEAAAVRAIGAAIAEVSESGIVAAMPGQGQQPASGGRNREGSPDWGNSDERTSGARLAGEFADTTSSEESGSSENREESPEAAAGTSTLSNINTATAEELQQLPGIGPAYAGRILEWRVQNGRFTSIDQLIEIRGIGEKRLENIRPLVTL